jgi:endonuclease YncB( thermonuclease family)
MGVTLLVLGMLTADLAASETDFANSSEVIGTVISVHDGDTLTMLLDRRPIKIRLAEIDAPEKGQPFYQASGHTLRVLCGGQEAAFRQTGYDARNKRPVGRVVCRQTDVGSH